MEIIMKNEILKEIKQSLELFDSIQSRYKLNSPDAFYLLAGTAAQESNFKFKRQRVLINGKMTDGEACSYLQIEAATCIDILHNYVRYPTSKGIMYRKELEQVFNKITSLKLNNINKENIQQELLNNFTFAVFIARLCYYRQSFTFEKHNAEEYAYIWKRYYNTYMGKGSEKEFLKNYKSYEIDKVDYKML